MRAADVVYENVSHGTNGLEMQENWFFSRRVIDNVGIGK